MPKTSDASSFTQFRKLNAQTLATTGKPTQSSATPTTAGVTASVKASVVASIVSPRTSLVALSALKTSTKKRG